MAVMHRIPESEEHEGGHEAVTVDGVPHGASISTQRTPTPRAQR